MIKQDFQSAAAAPYAFDFAHEVAEFYAAHPAQKNKIIFVDAASNPGHVIGADDPAAVEARLTINPDYAANNKLAHETGSRADLYADLGYGCVMFNTTLPQQQGMLGAAAGRAVSDAFIFDHETAHLLCKEGLGNVNMGECVADAYATIRHLQRFGVGSPAIHRLVQRRAMETILGHNGSHFTAPVVERILSDRSRMDFAALTPEQTMDIAHQYARAAIMEGGMINRLISHSRQSGFGMAEALRGDFSGLEGFGAMLLGANNPDDFKWGAIAFRGLMSGDWAFDGKKLPKPGPQYNRLAEALEDRSRRFGLPLAVPRP